MAKLVGLRDFPQAQLSFMDIDLDKNESSKFYYKADEERAAGSEPSSSHTPRKERDANWQQAELQVMLNLYEKNAKVMNLPGVRVPETMEQRMKVMRAMTSAINKFNTQHGTGVKRSLEQVQSKLTRLRGKATKLWKSHCQATEKGDDPPEIPAILNRLVTLMGIGFFFNDDELKGTAEDSESSPSEEESGDDKKSPENEKERLEGLGGCNPQSVMGTPDWVTRPEVTNTKQLVIQTHLNTLSRTCEELGKLGVDASAFVFASDNVMTCGNDTVTVKQSNSQNAVAVLEVQQRSTCYTKLFRQLFDNRWQASIPDPPSSEHSDAQHPPTARDKPPADSRGKSVRRPGRAFSSDRGCGGRKRKRKSCRVDCASEALDEVPAEAAEPSVRQTHQLRKKYDEQPGQEICHAGCPSTKKLATEMSVLKRENTVYDAPENMSVCSDQDSHKDNFEALGLEAGGGLVLGFPLLNADFSDIKAIKQELDEAVKVSSSEDKFADEQNPREKPAISSIDDDALQTWTPLFIRKERDTLPLPEIGDIAKTPRRFKCDLCLRGFKSKGHLTRHEAVHTQKKFTCDLCPKSFVNKHYREKHRHYFHFGYKPFQCEQCGRAFTEKHNLRTHMRMHNDERPYKCEYCPEAFYIAATLTVHRRRHTGERPFLCDDCGASFVTGTKLKIHQRSHTGEKPQVCVDCGEQFKEREQLNVHRRKHTGIQPYVCKYCGKPCTSAYKLTIHERLHTGEKPYACEICGQRFMRSDVLLQHKRKHSDVKQNPSSAVILQAGKLTCEVCGQMFSRPDVFAQHTKKHPQPHQEHAVPVYSGDMPYICDVCGKRFRRYDIFLQHIKKHPQKSLVPKPAVTLL